MTVVECDKNIFRLISVVTVFILSLLTFLLLSTNMVSAVLVTSIPGTIVSSSGVGTVTWNTPQEANASDNSYASSALAKSQQSYYLNASNFGFNIPPGSTINGITVNIERHASTGNRVSDAVLQLMKNGVISGNDYSSAVRWSTTLNTVFTYGGVSDLWGLSWTYSDINNANFGIVLSVTANNPATANVDYINVTINYTEPTVNLIVFAAPTPVNATVSYTDSAYINVTSNFDATLCQLNWSGTIYNMSGSGTNWYYNRTSISVGNYYYSVRCNDTLGWTNTSIRDISIATFPTITYVNPTYPDAWSTQNTSAYVNTTVTGSNIGSAFINWNYSLVLWLRLNNESGESTTFFKDSSTYGNNATCSGTGCPTYVNGIRGKALSFDRTNNEINITNSNSLNPPTQMTLSAWFKIDGNSGTNRYLISKPTSATWTAPYATYAIRLNTANNLDFWINDGSNTAKIVTSTATYSADSLWRHLVATFNGTELRIYVNGQIQGSKTLIDIVNSSTQAVYIGTTGRTTTERWNGSIDDIQIFNRAFSESEVNASYNASTYLLYRNFTNLPVGNYWYTSYIQDIFGGVNYTENRLFTVTLAPPDNTPPNVSQIFPSNPNTTQNTNISFSCNITDATEVYNLTLYIWNSSGNQLNTGTTWCYQESTNINTTCGGIGNGSYSVAGSWTTSANAYDGSWSTSASGGSSPSNFIYMTYTKPVNALNSSLWQIKDSVSTRNVTIPAVCWTGYGSELLFRAQASSSGNYVNWQCAAAGGSWQTVSSDGTSTLVYEEAMFWNINLSTSTTSVGGTVNQSSWTFNFPYDGVFTWSCLGYDVANNKAWAPTNYTITILPQNVPPSIALITINDFLTPEDQIILSAGTRRNVSCFVTATNFYGASNILNASAKFYYYLNTSSQPDNNNTHYTNLNCTVNETTSSNKTFECIFPIYYFANNGTWNCNATVYNTDALHASNVSNTTINPLYAINLTDGLDFGTVGAGVESLEIIANVSNLGNMRVNVTVQGYAQTIGDAQAMNCSDAAFVPVANLRYALSSTIYSSKTSLTGSIQNLGLTISKPYSTIEIMNNTYWQIQSIPGVSNRRCEGFVMFTAESP